MPCSFDMAFDPFFYGRDVFGRVFEVVADGGWLGGGYEGGGWCAAGFGLDGPAAVLDAGGEMVGAAVSLGVSEIQVLSCGGGVIGKEPVRRNGLVDASRAAKGGLVTH